MKTPSPRPSNLAHPPMTVALFIPCYIDQFYPDVAIATLELLEQQQLQVVYPPGQTCCGQPMANTGCNADTAPVAQRFVELFAPYDYVVCPSGSCAAMVRQHYAEYFPPGDPQFEKVRNATYELCEFLVDVVQVQQLPARFPHRASVHLSCHGLRELRLANSSETRCPPIVDRMGSLLAKVADLELVQPSRSDECCGFGGTFAVNEAQVSAAMGRDRIADHQAVDSEVIIAGDMSCLMHLQGLLRRSANPLQVMHVAQVLAGRPLPAADPPAVHPPAADPPAATVGAVAADGSDALPNAPSH